MLKNCSAQCPNADYEADVDAALLNVISRLVKKILSKLKLYFEGNYAYHLWGCCRHLLENVEHSHRIHLSLHVEGNQQQEGVQMGYE